MSGVGAGTVARYDAVMKSDNEGLARGNGIGGGFLNGLLFVLFEWLILWNKWTLIIEYRWMV